RGLLPRWNWACARSSRKRIGSTDQTRGRFGLGEIHRASGDRNDRAELAPGLAQFSEWVKRFARKSEHAGCCAHVTLGDGALQKGVGQTACFANCAKYLTFVLGKHGGLRVPR